MGDIQTIYLYCMAFSVGIASAFCSLAESSIVALSDYNVKNISKDNKKLEKNLTKIMDDKSKYLSAIIMFNTLVNIGGSMFVGSLAATLYTEDYYVAFVTAMTVSMLLFSEIKPKVFAARNPDRVIKVLNKPILFTTWILAPFVNTVNGFLNNNNHDESTMSLDELNHFIATAKETGLIKKEEASIIKNIVDLRAKSSDVVIKTNKVTTLPVGAIISECKDELLNSIHRRIVLVNEENKPVGVFFREDALKRLITNESDVPLSRIMHPVPVVGLDVNLTVLAKNLQRSGAHLSVVVDENGDMVGTVTLTDVKGMIFS